MGVWVQQPGSAESSSTQLEALRITNFKPYVGKKRKPGTGCVSKINDHLFESGAPPCGPMARSTPEMSTPRPGRSARRS